MSELKMKMLKVITNVLFVTATMMTVVPVYAVELDADGNGLYDDAERKVLVDTFQRVCPSLKDTTFDADGDGKVTILEQTQGRHPLSMTIGQEVIKSGVQIPWGIDIFPESSVLAVRGPWFAVPAGLPVDPARRRSATPERRRRPLD